MPVFIGIVLTWLADRLGVRLALAVTIITIVAGMYTVFVVALTELMGQVTVPGGHEYITLALQAFPDNTPQLMSAIFAAKTAKWFFQVKMAAIKWYISPQKTLF